MNRRRTYTFICPSCGGMGTIANTMCPQCAGTGQVTICSRDIAPSAKSTTNEEFIENGGSA